MQRVIQVYQKSNFKFLFGEIEHLQNGLNFSMQGSNLSKNMIIVLQ